jgi:Icc-related predicted phosphoesterase
MKILAIADTHTYYKDLCIKENEDDNLILEDADVLIHAGDIDARNLRELYQFANWMGSLDYKYKIVVGGNHDFALTKNYLFVKTYMEERGVIYLENEEVTLDGIKFWGSPITPVYGNWAFMKHRGNEIARIWHQMPEDTRVLITHGPPLQILDNSHYGGHSGCYDLFKKIEEVKPKVHIFGHIHEGYGNEVKQWNSVDSQGVPKSTHFYNVSALDKDYNLVNKPTVIYV